MLIYNFWYDYVKPKFVKKARLCYMDEDSFIVYIKANDKILRLDLILQVMNEINHYQTEKLKN